MKKLLIMAPSSVHTYNYISLISNYFDDILLISNKKENDEINTIVVDFSLKFNIFKSIKTIKNIINNYNPTIIHVHQANSYGFISASALKSCKTPSVITTWGSDILVTPKKNAILKYMLKYTLNCYNAITADSFYVANEIKEYTNNQNIYVANFGIKELNSSKEKENIIYSNRLHNKLYNIDKVIKNFNNFLKTHNNWKLYIAATGTQTQELKDLVKELNIEDKVEFLGWVDSKTNEQMYKKAKIYISIPSSDATSISLLEAIASNCICFVSNLPANSEHILDKINGFIEPNIDNIDFSKYKNIDINLMQKVNSIRKQEYSKDTNREKFIAIYNKLIG